METIKDVVKNLIRGWEEKNRRSLKDNPEVLLKKVLTPKEQEHIQFNYFKRGIIGVAVDSSSWLYHFNLQKRDLLAKLCELSCAIKDIRFGIGEIKRK